MEFRKLRSKIVGKLYEIADLCYFFPKSPVEEFHANIFYFKIRTNIHCVDGWSDFLIKENFPEARGALTAADLCKLENEEWELTEEEKKELAPSQFLGLCDQLKSCLLFPFKDLPSFRCMGLIPLIEKDIMETSWCLDTLYRMSAKHAGNSVPH